jgi:outer membrane biogenesis lipoprotein LolB
LHKIVIAGFVCLFLFEGCATTRGTNRAITDNGNVVGLEILRHVAEKNLTATGFFIQKGKISTKSENGRISLYFTMKYSSEGKYLISLRSKTGMEAFRVYLSKDSILINDRLKRNVLYGKAGDFEKITGLPASMLKISVGDLFMNKPADNGESNCINNEFKVSDYLFGLMINSTINCLQMKLKSVIVFTGEENKFITIDYSKYREDNYSVPRKIEINDSGRKIKITISIEKYMAPWVGDIDFLPGNGYISKPLI